MSPERKRSAFHTWTALVLVLMLVVSACAGDEGAPATTLSPTTEGPDPTESPGTTEAPATEAPTTTAPAEPVEMETLTLAVFPAIDYAPLFIGVEQGVFESHGLELDIEFVFSGVALMSAVTSGQKDIASNSTTAGVTGIVNGLPIRMLFAVNIQPTEGHSEILVREDSDILDWADLEGKAVATTNLEGRFHHGLLAAVEAAGLEWESVEALPISASDSPAALVAGQIDAAMVQDPFLTTAKNELPVRSLGNPFVFLDYDVPSAGFYSSNETIERKPEALRRFREAYYEASDLARDNPELVYAIIPEFTNIDEATARVTALPIWDARVGTEENLLPMMQDMVRYGWMTYVPSHTQIVWVEE